MVIFLQVWCGASWTAIFREQCSGYPRKKFRSNRFLGARPRAWWKKRKACKRWMI